MELLFVQAIFVWIVVTDMRAFSGRGKESPKNPR